MGDLAVRRQSLAEEPAWPGWTGMAPASAASITVRVRAKPRARVERLTRNADGTLTARVTAPPVQGKANAAIEELVARSLGMRRRDVTIRGGAGSRLKRVELRCDDPAALAAVIEKLEVE